MEFNINGNKSQKSDSYFSTTKDDNRIYLTNVMWKLVKTNAF